MKHIMQVTIEPNDCVRVLPEDAWSKIHTLLFNSEVDAPGREELTETYAKMLYHACHKAQAHNLLLEKKCRMMKKVFDNWRPVVTKMRKGSS